MIHNTLQQMKKIIINENELENGEYTIHTFGGVFANGQIPDGSKKQDFAVVASGPIKNGYLEFSDSSECPCDECDKNRPSYCICNENEEVGQLCQSTYTINVSDKAKLNRVFIIIISLTVAVIIGLFVLCIFCCRKMKCCKCCSCYRCCNKSTRSEIEPFLEYLSQYHASINEVN